MIDPRLKGHLAALYLQMEACKQKKKRTVDIDRRPGEGNFRRCNKCGEYHLIENTVLRKYFPTSKRKYRLCRLCDKKYGRGIL